MIILSTLYKINYTILIKNRQKVLLDTDWFEIDYIIITWYYYCKVSGGRGD
jgi:hypothetical protein